MSDVDQSQSPAHSLTPDQEHGEAQHHALSVEGSTPAAPSMLAAASASLGGGVVRRKIARRLARRGDGNNGVAAGADGLINAAGSGGGNPLPANLQQQFGSSLGADLSSVRVHTGADSAAAADAVSARAYTIGNDIHFNAGQYDPGSREGQNLLAHEVAHTVQQSGGAGASGGAQTKLEVSEPGDAHEVEADAAAEAMVSGAPAHVFGQATTVSRNIFGDMWNGIKAAGSAIGGAISGAAHAVGDAVSGAVHAIGEGLANVGDWITERAAMLGIISYPEGVVTKEVPANGSTPKLPVGTFVHVKAIKHTGEMKVHAYSGINADATMQKDSFRAEPGLVHDHDQTGKDLGPRDDVYQEYAGPLWGPEGPKAEDAYTQGALGDCYFMASMAAVCGSNPQQIKSRFNPQTPSKNYTVTFYKRTGTSLNPVSYTISNWLPSARGQDHQQVYANTGATPSAKNAGPTGNANQGALWVSFLEKAWAMHKGSYEAAAGGWGADGMEALTGVASQTEHTAHGRITGSDGKGGGLLDKFRQFQAENKAVAVGTIKDPAEVNHGWTAGKFTASGDTLTAQLDASLVFQTVQINATGTNSFYGKDDSNNNILQQSGTAQLVEGKVDYQLGKVTLRFAPGKAPDPANVQAAWDNCGADFQKYGLCGTHEYHFTSVKEPDSINMMNPWGFQHPKPVDEVGMSKCFSEIASNAVPQPDRRGESDLAPRNGRGGGSAYA